MRFWGDLNNMEAELLVVKRLLGWQHGGRLYIRTEWRLKIKLAKTITWTQLAPIFSLILGVLKGKGCVTTLMCNTKGGALALRMIVPRFLTILRNPSNHFGVSKPERENLKNFFNQKRWQKNKISMSTKERNEIADLR